MSNILATSNIANKIRNTRLPRTKPLMPLFEIISNSIHAIDEAKKINQLKDNGNISVKCIRNGDEETLKQLPEINSYPIHSFLIEDNGIGLNEENLKAFTEADTDHKISIGGKGVGRFVSLKAFRELNISSQFFNTKNELESISFNLKATKEGFHDYSKPPIKGTKTGTSIKLSGYREEYQKNVDYALVSVSREIISHFLLYFIRKQAPKIIVKNQNEIEFNLSNLFETEFKGDVVDKEFKIGEEIFTIYLTKSIKSQSHKIHFCAHNRIVTSEGLYSKIVDLGKKPIDDNGNKFFYQAYVVGKVLDENVDTERVGFNFPDNDEEDAVDSTDINYSRLLRYSLKCIEEEMLAEYLMTIRTQKVESYKPTIDEEFPQYRSVLNHKKSEVLRLPPDLTKEKLDVELYKIEAQWRLEVKEEKIKLLNEENKNTAPDDYKDYVRKYEKFISDFNEIGKSDLARYVVHRKSIIELLDKLIEQLASKNFANEDLIHKVFFPMRSTSDEILPEQQNLWLIDERLTYHSFLASDKTFNSVENIDSNSINRPDIIVFNDPQVFEGAYAFSDSKTAPHNSFTIVEFKKPMRDDYDEKSNPITQTERYIDDLLGKKVYARNGRLVEVDTNTPFYIYIVCDITESLLRILKTKEFDKTPDGKGYYKMKSKYYSAYFEVMPFEKVLNDANKRNRILFEKLKID